MSNSGILRRGVNNVSNAEYHGDKSWYSSTQLKTILKSRESFYKDYVLGQKTFGGSKPHLEEGSYVHSLILEPHRIKEEYEFFDGWRKSGEDWKKFLGENNTDGKIVLSKPQQKRCESYYEAYKERPEAVSLIEQGGIAEHSVAAIINDVQVKVRADWINVEKGYIADVKTSAFSVDHDSFRHTVAKWGYDFSAATYCKVFEEHYKKPFDFYFIAISKNEKVCEVFKLSDDTKESGEMAFIRSLSILKDCMLSGDWSDDKKSALTTKTDYEILEI